MIMILCVNKDFFASEHFGTRSTSDRIQEHRSRNLHFLGRFLGRFLTRKRVTGTPLLLTAVGVRGKVDLCASTGLN